MFLFSVRVTEETATATVDLSQPETSETSVTSVTSVTPCYLTLTVCRCLSYLTSSSCSDA